MAQINNNTSTMLIEKKRSLTPDSISTTEVRILGIDHCEQAAHTLALAFAEDEVAKYFIDTEDLASYSEEYKWKLHCDIIRYITAAHCYNGIVTAIGPDYDGVALWMPPGKNMDDWWTILRSGMWRLNYKLSSEGRARFYNEFLPLLHNVKRDTMGDRDDDSYYLVYIGCKPSARGKGYARKLIEHMTSKADAENRATYLESSADRNVPIYTRLGFEFKRDVHLVRAEPQVKLSIMVREPKPVAKGRLSKELVQQSVRIRTLV
ncbi:hypothetical protein B7494_g8545 [Chlorociboria aeruginascens]|nr:hypothetical protein B7494_g8545 [Chlorociboria aeruginascens]